MELNDVIKVSDIQVENLTIVDNANKVLAAVLPTRNVVAEEASDEAAEGAEA